MAHWAYVYFYSLLLPPAIPSRKFSVIQLIKKCWPYCISLTMTLLSRSPGSYNIFIFGNFEGGTNCHLWIWKVLIMSIYACIEDLPNIHQPDQFDLCEGLSSNRHFQLKSVGFHLTRHKSFETMRPRDPTPDL